MTMAFVLINVDLGAEEQVTKQLKTIDGVKEVHGVYGVYDIMTKVEADSREGINEVVIGRIRKLDKVRSTLTMIVIE